MAINIKFDLAGNPEPPTIILSTRNGNKLGQLEVNQEDIELVDRFSDKSEISFVLNKYVDGRLTNLWDKVVDFKLIYCKEWDMWFEIKVELDEATETVKTVLGVQLGQAELSQIMIYDMQINEEGDSNWSSVGDYKISILYDENDPKASVLNRLLDKAPHYSIEHVDFTIANIQRSFSFDDVSICDAFQQIAEEIGCLFVYNSGSDENGKPKRTISVYDLQQKCLKLDCGFRGEFIDVCPKCGGTDIKYGYGDDTTIFVTSDELASEGIQLTTDTESVKNCFKLEAGDDLMTATIRNCNPNGTDYIWYFSESTKDDMPDELVEKLESYDELYEYYHNDHESHLNDNLAEKYNELVQKYKDYYNEKSYCLNCKYEGFFEDNCPECGNAIIVSGKMLQPISPIIKGYPSLMNAYYNVIDLGLYLESALMPSVNIDDTDAKEQAELLVSSFPSTVAVNTKKMESISGATADSAVLSMAKVIIRPTYKVQIDDSTFNENTFTWTGNFIVTNYSDDEDRYPKADSDGKVSITVKVNNDEETFIKQKIEKTLNKDNTDDYSITGLFKKDYDDFCAELKKYALNPLKGFYDSCDACLNVLVDNGVGNKEEKSDLYNKLYVPYYSKSTAISNEIKIREQEIAIIKGVYNKTSDEKNPVLITKGLQQYIEECRNDIQSALDFEGYLGKNLWVVFCSYRRESKFSNENYKSDGLDNAKLFARANEFIDKAENEIYKSAELQHSISATLNNLLAIPKFKQLVKHFKSGNWIRVRIDDGIYKLRLLEYTISYGSFNNIDVEFSDVTKVKNSITDIESALSKASSMASSYESVQRQAKQGNEALGTIDDWISVGLNTALVQIQNNSTEDIIINKNGILGRSYNELTDTYSPEQLRITHNILAYTTDNWQTVSSALGKHGYVKWQNNEWVRDEDYGLTSKFVTAGYVTGSQMIGGEIVSSNYKPRERGTYFNLIDGDFEIAGGNITYDTNDKALTLRNVTIEWDNTNAPDVTINDVSGLDEYLKQQLGDLENQLDGRAQTWYQDTDPSIDWGTNDLKALHEGDLWHYTGNTGVVNGVNRTKNSEWCWENVDGNYQWIKIEISDDVFDMIDGKSSIYVSKPQSQEVGDLLIPSASFASTYNSKNYYFIEKKIYRCTLSSDSFRPDCWIEVAYTDDSSLNNFISGEYADDLLKIGGQLDGKARAWYQSTDPSLTWDKNENHEGDLWYNSFANSQNTYIYDNGAWRQTSVPKELFDTIDGIASIYVTIPDKPVIGDLLIPAEDITVGDKTYKAGKVYRYNGKTWMEISYTDDTRAEEAYAIADSSKSIAENAKELGDILKNAVGLTQISDTYVISPVIAGGTLLIGDKEGTYAQITRDGQLICNGARISGTIEWGATNPPKANDIDGLQDYLDQLDGRIQTFSQSEDPSLNWKTNEDREAHVGDLWFDPDDGLTRRWNGTYWDIVTDSGLIALVNTKAQIFTVQPIPPYKVGDLWVQGVNGDIMNCIKERLEGESFSASDWVKSSKYTDDTKALEALEKAKEGIAQAASSISLAEAAQKAASEAKTAAGNAETNAKGYADIVGTNVTNTLTEAYKKYTDSEVSKLDSYVADYLGLGGNTIIGEDYVISPYIGGGYLNVAGAKIDGYDAPRVIIDPNNLTGNNYIFQIHNGKQVSLGIDKDGNSIFSGSLVGCSLIGKEVSLMDNDGLAATFRLTGSSSWDGSALNVSSGAISLTSMVGDIYISANDGSEGNDVHLQLFSEEKFISSNSDFVPASDGKLCLGNSNLIWKDIYLQNSSAITSDRNKKHSIEDLPTKYIDMMDLLTTKRFKLNNGESDRYHIGFIAQDVEDAMAYAHIDSKEFGGWIKDIDEDGNDMYMLRYEEFIGILHEEIKSLRSKVRELEKRL